MGIKLMKMESPKVFGDSRQLMKILAADMEKEVGLRFRNSKDPQGNSWKPLSEYTIKRRRKRSNKPLLDTGLLRNSISPRTTETEAMVGTNLDYAKTQQMGDKKRGIPAREYLGFSGNQIEIYGKIIARYINKKAR